MLPGQKSKKTVETGLFIDKGILDKFDLFSRHGNNCAGVIAGVANNKLCGVGLAYNAQIAGMLAIYTMPS